MELLTFLYCCLVTKGVTQLLSDKVVQWLLLELRAFMITSLNPFIELESISYKRLTLSSKYKYVGSSMHNSFSLCYIISSNSKWRHILRKLIPSK